MSKYYYIKLSDLEVEEIRLLKVLEDSDSADFNATDRELAIDLLNRIREEVVFLSRKLLPLTEDEELSLQGYSKWEPSEQFELHRTDYMREVIKDDFYMDYSRLRNSKYPEREKWIMPKARITFENQERLDLLNMRKFARDVFTEDEYRVWLYRTIKQEL